MFARIAAISTALLALVPASLAQNAKEASATKPALTVGMPVPAISVDTWVKGKPVESFEKGKVYVVEFWATWCGPCIASMPHLSELQRKYAPQGVTIIGMTTEDPNNSLEKVEKMVAEKGDGMAYTVAWDKGTATKEALFRAAGQRGIPCSFLIDQQGSIAYIGHPLFLEEPLAGVLSGSWKGTEQAEAFTALQNEYWGWRSKVAEDAAGALAFAKAFNSKHPLLAELTREMIYEAAFATGDYALASEVGAKIVDEAIAAKNAMALNQFAWPIVDPEAKLEKRDLDLALRAATAAVEITQSKDASVLDTLARCHAWKGDYKKAFDLQTLAIEVANERMKDSLRGALEEYRGKLGSK